LDNNASGHGTNSNVIQNSIPGQHKLCEFNDPSAIRRNGIEYYKAHVHH